MCVRLSVRPSSRPTGLDVCHPLSININSFTLPVTTNCQLWVVVNRSFKLFSVSDDMSPPSLAVVLHGNMTLNWETLLFNRL